VTEPIRLHVDAKRYLCATDDAYNDGLSAASVRSLRLQGGPFRAAEAEEFIARPYAREAVRIRRWDDLAKDPERQTPPLDHYMTHVRDLCHA
jgi:predicted HD phosphohydrolase